MEKGHPDEPADQGLDGKTESTHVGWLDKMTGEFENQVYWPWIQEYSDVPYIFPLFSEGWIAGFKRFLLVGGFKPPEKKILLTGPHMRSSP